MILRRLRGRLPSALELSSVRRVEKANPKDPIASIRGQSYIALFSSQSILHDILIEFFVISIGSETDQRYFSDAKIVARRSQ
jgi:hypothetical protein